MKRFDGFTEFVATHNAALSRPAYLLSGNHTDAQDLLQTALTKTATRWGQVARYDSPAAFTRRVMITWSTTIQSLFCYWTWGHTWSYATSRFS